MRLTHSREGLIARRATIAAKKIAFPPFKLVIYMRQASQLGFGFSGRLGSRSGWVGSGLKASSLGRVGSPK